MQRMIIDARPDFETTNVPSQPWRKKFHKLVSSTQFDIVIIVCIVLNMLQMALFYEGSNAMWDTVLD